MNQQSAPKTCIVARYLHRPNPEVFLLGPSVFMFSHLLAGALRSINRVSGFRLIDCFELQGLDTLVDSILIAFFEDQVQPALISFEFAIKCSEGQFSVDSFERGDGDTN